jgi:hypothetical protein
LFRLKGTLYFGPDASLRPAHHFYRVIGKYASKKLYPPKVFAVAEWNWIGLNFRNLYDVLGAFLMVIGIFHPTSTKVNFFLPLTAMYAMWCSKLGGHPDGQDPKNKDPERPGEWPTVYQCTWLNPKMVLKTGRFCLGASFQGCDFSNHVEGVGWEWAERLRDERLDMLRAANAFDNKRYTDTKPRKQLEDREPLGNSRWGNCAEAYPFTTMFR